MLPQSSLEDCTGCKNVPASRNVFFAITQNKNRNSGDIKPGSHIQPPVLPPSTGQNGANTGEQGPTQTARTLPHPEFGIQRPNAHHVHSLGATVSDTNHRAYDAAARQQNANDASRQSVSCGAAGHREPAGRFFPPASPKTAPRPLPCR